MQPGTLSASAGTLMFRAGDARFVRQFTWVDRQGTPIATVGEPLGNPDGVSASPDGSQLVYFERGATSSDLWLLETRRGVVSRFTDDADENVFPLWARDPDWIVYSTSRSGQSAIHQRHVGTGAAEELIPPQAQGIIASDVSPDGRYLVYQRMDAATGWDVWALPLDGSGESVPVVRTGADERGARLSPDGGWVAFVANTSGTFEVYVQPFLGSGRPVRVSTRGGDQPQWRADGAELFYIALDGTLTAVAVMPGAAGQSIDVGPPIPLFPSGAGDAAVPVIGANYVASADGQRFLVNRLLRETGETPLRVVLHWTRDH